MKNQNLKKTLEAGFPIKVGDRFEVPLDLKNKVFLEVSLVKEYSLRTFDQPARTYVDIEFNYSGVWQLVSIGGSVNITDKDKLTMNFWFRTRPDPELLNGAFRGINGLDSVKRMGNVVLIPAGNIL